MPRTLIVSIESSLCMSHQLCVAEFPEAFALNEEFVAQLQSGESDLTDEQLLAVARSCPMMAISLTDKNGKSVQVH
jgi:ferredoxin